MPSAIENVKELANAYQGIMGTESTRNDLYVGIAVNINVKQCSGSE